MRYLYLPLVILALLGGGLPQGENNLPLCSTAVHDRYRTQGPDGKSYPTWHPQVDAYYHCRFDHEHGSDPSLILPGFKPLYGYSARGMTEPEPGFKGYAFRLGGYGWYLTQHQGTANAALAACTRPHTLDMLIVNDAGQTLANIHLMADFGAAASNETGLPLSTLCPQPAGSHGTRQFPIASLHNIGYEPWRADAPGNVIGLRLANLTFNTVNPVTACDTLTCTVALPRIDPGIGPALGTYRFLTAYSGMGITATGPYSGTFTTNIDATGPGDTQQYIAPGIAISLPLTVALYPYGGQTYWYAPTVPSYDSLPFRLNPLITGPN